MGRGGRQEYQSVFAVGNGIMYGMYGITSGGDTLWWYRHDGWQDGTPRWTGEQGMSVWGTIGISTNRCSPPATGSST